MTSNIANNSPQFSNRYVQQLPGDAIRENFCRQVSGSAWSKVRPTRVSAPQLLALNEDLAKTLGLGHLMQDRAWLAQILSGNELLPGMEPYAMAYGGHQFGNWAGQLGDGRAINLGEVRDCHGSFQTLQLKGAGPTPYSRHADGRAVLRSSLREYLCSEAMAALGVPTTRALSLVQSGDSVVRDMFYDGHAQAETGAIVCRVAPSFIRFGHFELPASRGDIDLLRKLVHFVIRTDWPALGAALDQSATEAITKQIYLDWFSKVCAASQHMVLQWMRVGFVHGVMNTDNMSVLGLTIDYGPYGWIDDYDPDWTPNTTDAGQRRYRFGQQPAIVRWNLYQLANALYPLIEDAEALQSVLQSLPGSYHAAHLEMMCQKLGIEHTAPQAPELVETLPALLSCQATDMTLFFRALAQFDSTDPECRLHSCVAAAFYDEQGVLPVNTQRYQEWENRYRLSLSNSLQNSLQSDPHHTSDQRLRKQKMDAVNPAFVPRNYLAQQAIDAMEEGDDEVFFSLLSTLQTPYLDQPQYQQRFGQKRPTWAVNKAGCSMLSCSS